MRKLVFCLLIICLLIPLAGCKPKYVVADSMEEVYSMAIKELEKARTKQEMELANLKVQNEILEAQLWYLKNDSNNPRLIELDKMLSIIKEE